MTHRFALRAFATALIIVAIVGCGGPLQSTPSQTSQLPTVDDFTPEKLGEYRGKVVVLNFWAAWCLPCRAEMPDFQAVYEARAGEGFEVLAINRGESAAVVEAFRDENERMNARIRSQEVQAQLEELEGLEAEVDDHATGKRAMSPGAVKQLQSLGYSAGRVGDRK